MVFKYRTYAPRSLLPGKMPENQTGFYLWSCTLPPTSTNTYYPLFYDTCKIDYSAFTSNGLTMEQVSAAVVGTHPLYLQFSCGGAGCGNYQVFTFLYDAVGAKQPCAGSATKTRLPGVALVNMAAAHRMTAGVLNSGTAFDIYGRRLAGADRTAGLVVVKNSR